MNQKNFIELITRLMLLSALVWLILLAGCKSTEVESHWSVQPVQVDGRFTEWNDIPTIYLEESGVQLGLCNDTENLYVLFRFSDQTWAQAIRMGGLTMWLDNSGKKKKDFGIRYTGGPSFPEMQKPGMEGEGGFLDSLTPEQKERLMERQASMTNQITVIQKEKDQEITLPADGSKGPAVAFADTQSIFTYEFSIPLQKGDVFGYALGAESGQTISIGLEWGGMGDNQRSMEKMGGGPPGGMGSGPPPGGMGGSPPGGMGGGPPGGGRGGSGMKAPEEQEVWVKTKIASPSQEQE